MRRALTGLLSMLSMIVLGSSLSHAFVHPGLVNNRAEYDLMKAKVSAKADPWYSAYKKIPDFSNYTPKPIANFTTEVGGSSQGWTMLNDGNAAYASTLHWIVTGNTKHAAKAKQIVNAWSYTLKSVCCAPQTHLELSWKWYPFMLAAEILKHTSTGWSSADQAQFEKVLRTFIIPNLQGTDVDGSSSNKARSNWAAFGASTRMAIGIYLNDQTMFTKAVTDSRALINFYIGKFGNPVPPGFTFETCRLGNGSMGTLDGGDIVHTQMALGALVQAAEKAKKQGVNLYGHVDPSDGASLRTALVYHAPFIGFPGRGSDATWPCDKALEDSNIHPGPVMPWHMSYNQYRDQPLQAVSNYQGTVQTRTGASYDRFTHNYSGTTSSFEPSVAISSPDNIRVVTAK